MKSREILRGLVRRFGLLLLLTLIGGVAGAVYSAVKTPTYTAKAYVVAIGDRGESITALNFAQAYGRVATSGPVLAAAGAKLGADRTGLKDVTASTSPDAPVIEVTATGSTARHTADLANAVANALADYGNTRKAETHVSLGLLAGALVPTSPSSPKPPLELAVGAAGGLLIGGLAVLAGVGRMSAAEEKAGREEAATVGRYDAEVDDAAEVDDVDDADEVAEADEVQDADEVEPAPAPKEIEQYTAVARAQVPPKAITSGRAVVASTYLEPDSQQKSDAVTPVEVTPPIPGQRIVGRAVVAGTEEW